MELHPKPKQPIQVNRPLIITIAVVVVIALLLAIVAALTVTNQTKKRGADSSSLKIAADKFVVSPELKGLPKDYSDIDAIKRFSSDTSSSKLAALMQQFSELQNDYALLRQQLLAKSSSTPEAKPVDPRLQDAKKADIVVSGLGSKTENLLGSQTDKPSPFQTDKDKETLQATPQQEELFKKQAQNAQKLAVMKGKDNPEDIYDMHNMIKPVSKYQIMAGTLIPATLITGVDTTLEGTLVAQVRSNVYDTVTGKHLLIPKGTKIIGDYSRRVDQGQSRVPVAFNRLIRPDGTSILLGKMGGADEMGKVGVEGNVNNHWARIIGAATISTILGVGAGIAGDNSGNDNSFLQNARGRAFGGAARGISDAGSSIVNRDLNIPPTITFNPGKQFVMAVKKDIVLPPFKPKHYYTKQYVK